MTKDTYYPISTKKFVDIHYDSAIYISGKMSGLPDLGKDNFDKVVKILRNNSRSCILNPYEMVDQTQNISWEESMRIDILDVMERQVKAMVLMDNWQDSRGATLEVILFLVLKIPIYSVSLENITHPTYMKFTPEFLHTKFIEMVCK